MSTLLCPSNIGSCGRNRHMNDDFFSPLDVNKYIFLICFCFDGNQSKQVVISVSMFHLVDRMLYGLRHCELPFIIE